jgi:hypothetical protein
MLVTVSWWKRKRDYAEFAHGASYSPGISRFRENYRSFRPQTATVQVLSCLGSVIYVVKYFSFPLLFQGFPAFLTGFACEFEAVSA